MMVQSNQCHHFDAAQSVSIGVDYRESLDGHWRVVNVTNFKDFGRENKKRNARFVWSRLLAFKMSQRRHMFKNAY